MKSVYKKQMGHMWYKTEIKLMHQMAQLSEYIGTDVKKTMVNAV